LSLEHGVRNILKFRTGRWQHFEFRTWRSQHFKIIEHGDRNILSPEQALAHHGPWKAQVWAHNGPWASLGPSWPISP
jgi:hypothetical protein